MITSPREVDIGKSLVNMQNVCDGATIFCLQVNINVLLTTSGERPHPIRFSFANRI